MPTAHPQGTRRAARRRREGLGLEHVSRERLRRAGLYRQAVCQEYGVAESELLGPGREQRVAEARQVWCYLLMSDLGLTSIQAGLLVGRDHTTVLHARGRIAARATSPRLAARLDEIRAAYLRLDRRASEQAGAAPAAPEDAQGERPSPRLRQRRAARSCPAVERVAAERMPPVWYPDPLSLYWRQTLRRRERALSYRTGAAQWS